MNCVLYWDNSSTEDIEMHDTGPGLINRRALLQGVGAAGVATFVLSTTSALAQGAPPAAAPEVWEAAVKKIIGDAKPLEGKITLDVPEIAENGNTVPFTVVVDSPMTENEYVKAVHVFSTANPQPMVGTFHFTPDSGKAAVSSRMRLAQTQDVVSVAELSDGQFAMIKRTVKVTIGGCGG